MTHRPGRRFVPGVSARVEWSPAKRRCARSSMDRASDYGSEGWGFESLRARGNPPRCDPPVGVLLCPQGGRDDADPRRLGPPLVFTESHRGCPPPGFVAGVHRIPPRMSAAGVRCWCSPDPGAEAHCWSPPPMPTVGPPVATDNDEGVSAAFIRCTAVCAAQRVVARSSSSVGSDIVCCRRGRVHRLPSEACLEVLVRRASAEGEGTGGVRGGRAAASDRRTRGGPPSAPRPHRCR